MEMSETDGDAATEQVEHDGTNETANAPIGAQETRQEAGM